MCDGFPVFMEAFVDAQRAYEIVEDALNNDETGICERNIERTEKRRGIVPLKGFRAFLRRRRVCVGRRASRGR